MTKLRITALAAVALIATTAVAAAATAPTLTVGAPSLRTSKPTFSWTVGPEGETFSKVSIATSSATDPATGAFTGRSTVLTVTAGATKVTAAKPLFAGKYYASGMWAATAGATGYSPVLPFTIPRTATFGTASVDVPRSGTRAQLEGAVTSNVRALAITCKLFKGSEEIDTDSDTPTSGTPNKARDYSCTFRLDRGLDGERLRAVASVLLGSRTVSKSVTFTVESDRPGGGGGRPERPGR